MKTLIEKLKETGELTKKVIAENPAVTDVWYTFTDIPLAELRSVAEQHGQKLEFSKDKSRMRLQLGSWHYANCTIFCYSTKVKVKENLVIDEAMENI